MVARAVLKYVRISPRKFRLIIPLVKGRNPEEAMIALASVKKGASKYAIDLLKSVIANAKRVQGVDVSNLYISRFVADCGPMLKRFRAASMGRANMIKKRTSHITVELDVVSKKTDAKRGVIPQKETKRLKEAPDSKIKEKAVSKGKKQKTIK